MRISDWSSDVCSSDLAGVDVAEGHFLAGAGEEDHAHGAGHHEVDVGRGFLVADDLLMGLVVAPVNALRQALDLAQVEIAEDADLLESEAGAARKLVIGRHGPTHLRRAALPCGKRAVPSRS